MAAKNCPDCNEVNSSNNEVCKKCGAELPPSLSTVSPGPNASSNQTPWYKRLFGRK